MQIILNEELNQPPRYNYVIYEGEIPQSFHFDENKRYPRSRGNSIGRILEGLKQNEFEEYYLETRDFSNGISECNLPIAFYNSNYTKFMMIHYQSNDLPNDLSLRFLSYPCQVHQSMNSNNRWSYPIRAACFDGTEEILTEMSWNYIDSLLHFQGFFDSDERFVGDRKFYRELYKTVQTKGLSNTITRLAVVFDNKNETNNIYKWRVYQLNDFESQEDFTYIQRIVESIIK